MVSLVFSILPNYSKVFDWLSKLILDDPRSLLWFGFTLSCDWSVWFIQPIKCKTKTILTWSQAFSRASSRLPVFTLSFYWLMVMFIFALICSCDYFGFVFWHLIENCLSFLEVIYNLKPSLPNFKFFPSLYSFSTLAEYLLRIVSVIIIMHLIKEKGLSFVCSFLSIYLCSCSFLVWNFMKV